MPRVVRVGLFETNSSSTHSIVIDHGGKLVSRSVSRPVVVTTDEFGWEERTYHDWHTKASYCLTWCLQRFARLSHYDTHTQSNLIPEKDANVALLREVIEDHFLLEPGELVLLNDGGYIDHQSDTVAEEAFKSYESLRDFIFGERSVLITDNDNH